MRLKYFLLSILAVAIIGSFVVALDQQRRSAILIPTLSLTQANVGGSLLGDLINGVSVFQYSASASVQGVTIVRDVHNMPRCPSDATTATTVIGSEAPSSTDRFWLYEYSGNEQANNQAGLTGRDLFDGKFFISDGEFASATNDAIRTALYESLHTLTEISPGKVYYVMSALDLSFSCGDGVEMAQGGGGSSSSTSSSVSSSDPNLVTLRATLDADEAVPPTTSIAVGTGTATYHTVTKEFNYVLTNTVAETSDTITGVYIRRAPVGQTGSSVFYTVQSGVTLDISLGLGDFDFGGTTLTTTQANDLLSGLWYFDIRTAAHPNGAIRGQMLVVSGGSTGSGSSSSVSSGSGSSSVSSGTGSSSISSGSGSSSISAGSGSSSISSGTGSSSVSSGSGSCTPIACPNVLPVGCSYENPTFENGCQTDCGTLVCEDSSSSSSSSAVTCPMGTTCSIIELCTSGTVGEECGQSIGFQHVCCVPLGASSSSVSALCGNGTLDAGEECDDGNLIDGDGCFSNCASMIPPSNLSAMLSRWFADLHSFLTTLF